MKFLALLGLVFLVTICNAARTTTMPTVAAFEIFNPIDKASDSARSYYKPYNRSHLPGSGNSCAIGYLDSNYGYCTPTAIGFSDGAWLGIDMGKATEIGGVVTQGRKGTGQWVTTFTIKSSSDGSTWTDVGATFTGNTDDNTKVYNTFDSIVYARYIRLYPKGYNGFTSMRWGLMYVKDDGSCFAPVSTSMAETLAMDEGDLCELLGTQILGCHKFCGIYDSMPDPEKLCSCADKADSEPYATSQACQHWIAYCDDDDEFSFVKANCAYTCCHSRLG